MAYFVQADAAGDGGSQAVRVDSLDAALTVGKEWSTERCTNIRIVGDGRIFRLEQLTSLINRSNAADLYRGTRSIADAVEERVAEIICLHKDRDVGRL